MFKKRAKKSYSSRGRTLLKRCPTCERQLKSVLDYPLVHILSFQTFPVPDKAYSNCAINGPSEMEVKRAKEFYLSMVEISKTHPIYENKQFAKQKKIYLLDRYTCVAGAGEAFKQFLASGTKRMEFKNLLFEIKEDGFGRGEVFTVKKDMMPEVRKTAPKERLNGYCKRIKRLAGKTVSTEVLSPSKHLISNHICARLMPENGESSQDVGCVRAAMTIDSGGTISLIEPLFYFASMKLKGKFK